MKKRFDKLIATFLAFLILVLPAALSARERRGADLVIILKDGRYVTGELIAVKMDSLLLLNPAQKDESVDLVGIRSITIVKKSKAALGGAYGLLAGALGGVVASYTINKEDLGSAQMGAILGGAVFGVVGGLIGLGVGALAGKDKTIQLEGKSESAVKSVLADLRSKARIRDYK